MPRPSQLLRYLTLAIAGAAAMPAFGVDTAPGHPGWSARGPQPSQATTADWSPLPECAGFPLGETYDYQGLSGTYMARGAGVPGEALQLTLLVTRMDQVPRVEGQYGGWFSTASGPVWRIGPFSGISSNPASGNGFLLFYAGSDKPERLYIVASVIKHPTTKQISALCLYDSSDWWPPDSRPFTMWRVM
ncbi:hypothetical protein [Caldimonas brevitalea]|uniref:DUF4185 domain-containing protein n=1 Tax=Caldimonas brevitalea TaxID=413882 RepID=A0A0G3BIE0_9BURK|nr:hypothetical protein [Caldimonas brevitalea]AKJ29209.1 hypothetical protein AAW51_2518 [Caldimonas brevitalea]